MTDKQKNLDEIKKKLGRKASTVSRFMNSPIGKQVIQILEEEFPGGFGRSPYDTYRLGGNREPIEYLKLLQRVYTKLEDLDNET